ncbi:MAG: ABC transporter ATP-binding protein [Hyphomicrobiales bacterium]
MIDQVELTIDRQAQSATPERLLSVEGLSISFQTDEGAVRVVSDVSFALRPGQTLGLVGESGCGKSVTAQTLMRLLPMPPARIDQGHVFFEGEDLVGASERRLRSLRGDRLAMIFQEPMTSLNPTFTVGAQISEALMLHRGLSRAEARERAIAGLAEVGIGSPAERFDQYPHQLSGGLRQRVMIAMALACRPALLIADEPTTALDVTVQAQILALLDRLQRELGLCILLITHDLGVVAEICDDIAVMYAGRIVESGSAAEVLTRPRHPYTSGLLASSPRKAHRGQLLPTIPGSVPPPGARGKGCSFASRCTRTKERCRAEQPISYEIIPGHRVECWNPNP